MCCTGMYVHVHMYVQCVYVVSFRGVSMHGGGGGGTY